LTAYDASYLWLARMLGGELVTLDRKLAAAKTVITVRQKNRMRVQPSDHRRAPYHSERREMVVL
jgi:hypothetical protein